MGGGMLGMDDDYAYWRERERLPRNAPEHALLGPMEHRQFARETVQGNPLMAVPLAAAIPAYTLAKKMGMLNTRSPASMDEMWAGYHGLTEGMLSRLVPSAHAHHEQSETVQRPDGKWINVYGRALPRAGQMLPGTRAYDSVEEAEREARSRSESYQPREKRPTGRIPGMPSPYRG